MSFFEIVISLLFLCTFYNLLNLQENTYSKKNFKDLFNFSFLSLFFIICLYGATTDIRSSCLVTMKDQFAS